MVAPTASKLSSAWDVDRHSSKGWPQFLSAIQIQGLRGWKGETVEFRYPVIALAGVNGAGKSTVLKAAASAYRAPANGNAQTYYPDDFFPNTPWEEVSGASLNYIIRRGEKVEMISVRKPSHRWRGAPDRKERSSFFLDISRIQPANTQIGYGRTAQEVISAGTTDDLAEAQVSQVSRVLGRSYDQARIDRNDSKQIGVLTHAGIVYSNFHQGAGEDSVLDLLALVSSAPKQSLIIIDEVEAALHPQAQRSLVTELLRIALDKKHQIIVSTHSPYILDHLPSIARIFIAVDRESKREIMYGVSSEFALNLMDDEKHEELDIFCEDGSAEFLIERILAFAAPETLRRVRIVHVGPANAVKTLASIVCAGKLARKAVCVVDGDQESSTEYLRLPGDSAPEKEAYLSLSEDNWVAVAERLGRPAGEVLDAKDSAIRIENHHAWNAEIARLIGGTLRPTRVWEAIADVWVQDVLGKDSAKIWSEHIVAALDR